MKIGLTPAGGPQATAACVRRRFRYAACRACVDGCPTQALSLVDNQLVVNPNNCVACGDCLYVCPVGAIAGVTPAVRYVSGQTLVAPFSARPPGVEELLLWHRLHHIRFVAMAARQAPGWLLAVARLNLRLRQYGEPEWAFAAPAAAEIAPARRALLRARRTDAAALAVAPGKRRLRRLYPRYSDFSPQLEPQRCQLCLACVRACPEQALRVEGDTFAVDRARCTGCGGCEAVCLHQAVAVIPAVAPAETIALAMHPRRCASCHRAFPAFNPRESRCPLCRRHRHGMRE